MEELVYTESQYQRLAKYLQTLYDDHKISSSRSAISEV